MTVVTEAVLQLHGFNDPPDDVTPRTQSLNSDRTAFRHQCLAFHHLKLSFHHLTMLFREIIKFVVTRGQILRLKCTLHKFDFGLGSIPDPAGEHTALPQIL